MEFSQTFGAIIPTCEHVDRNVNGTQSESTDGSRDTDLRMVPQTYFRRDIRFLQTMEPIS